MSDDWQGLNGRIEGLRSLVAGSDGMLSPLKARSVRHPAGSLSPILLHDWRPAWDLAKSIQAAFTAGIKYDSRQDREVAWTKFNDARNELSKRSKADHEEMFNVSKAWRDLLFSDINAQRYSKLNDALFFFDPTTVEDMKASGKRLRDCGARLSAAKDSMLKEHKDECFQLILEVRQSHDRFWEQHKASHEQRHREIGERIKDVLSRVEENITKNREKRAKAADALSRCEANIYKLRDMLPNAKGDDFRSQVEGWLSEACDKRDSIRETIARIDEWIEQDVERRNDINSKRR